MLLETIRIYIWKFLKFAIITRYASLWTVAKCKHNATYTIITFCCFVSSLSHTNNNTTMVPCIIDCMYSNQDTWKDAQMHNPHTMLQSHSYKLIWKIRTPWCVFMYACTYACVSICMHACSYVYMYVYRMWSLGLILLHL